MGSFSSVSAAFKLRRVWLYDRLMNPIGELSEEAGNLSKCVRVEEINGEHSLSITTTRHLEIGTRAITFAMKRFSSVELAGKSPVEPIEWVLDEASEHHEDTEYGENDYHFCWSMQSDLKGIYGPVRQPGMASPASVNQALHAALVDTKMWIGSLGYADDPIHEVRSGAIMTADQSAWDRVSTVIKYWGGEVDEKIYLDDTVYPDSIERYVLIRSHIGDTSSAHYFEYGHNLTGITRTPSPGPYFCRVIPHGNGETYDADDGVATYEEPLTIEEVNGGRNYLSDTEAERTFRIGDGCGGYEYPSVVVSYSTDDPDELIALAREDLHSHTRPTVTYEGTLKAFRSAGLRDEGIALGDSVQIVDHKFNRDFPLRLEERVIRMEFDELRHDDTKITIGKFIPTIEKTMATVIETVGTKAVAVHQTPLDVSLDNETPELPVYTISTPVSEGIPYTVPSYDIPDYSSAIGDIENRVAGIESGGVHGGDGWVHMIDGVEQDVGTVDFRTVVSSDDTPSGGDHDESDEKEKETVADQWGNTGPATLYNKAMAAAGGFVTPEKRKASKWGIGF